MGLSGLEWANDWYAADYYAHSPVDNPQGPESGDGRYKGAIREGIISMP